MTNQRLFDLTGKVAIVTGGNGGLGLGIAMGLAGAGANIVIAARSVEKTAQALEDSRALGGEAHALTGQGIDDLAGNQDVVEDTLLCLLKTKEDRDAIPGEVVGRIFSKAV